MSGGPQIRWLTPAEQHYWRAYLRGGRRLMLALDRDLAAHGVSLPEYEILSMLSEQPARQMRMSELAEVIVQSRSRLTHTASRLERRELVTRQPCPDDRRGVLLTLTASGIDLVERIAPAHLASVREHLVDVLTPAQFAALGQAMDVVHTRLTASVHAD